MASAERIALVNYERNPDYLFARLNHAQFCLLNGRLDEIPIIFGDNFDLKLLYPHRNKFHISEFIGFSAVMIEYFIRIGDLEQAEIRYQMLEQIAPDAPATKKLGQLLTTSHLLSTIRKMMHFPRRRKRIRSANSVPPPQLNSKSPTSAPEIESP